MRRGIRWRRCCGSIAAIVGGVSVTGGGGVALGVGRQDWLLSSLVRRVSHGFIPCVSPEPSTTSEEQLHNPSTMSDSQDNKSLTLYLSLTSSPSAPRIPLTLPPTSNASTLRRLASAATNIPLDSMKLIFRGRVIGEKSEGDVGLEYKLEDESVIHVMGKPPVAAAGSGGGGAVAAAVGTNIAGASVSMNSSTPATSNTSSPLASAMLTLRTNNNSETYRTALATADKLLSNIISHPMEEKYRSIKKSNPAFHKRLGGVSGGEALLLASGFVVESGGGVESYVLRPSADAWPRLVAAGEEIQRVLTEANATSASSPSAAYDNNNNNNNAATSGGGAGGMSNLFPGGIPSNAMGGSLGGPGMEAAMQSMLSNPQMLQNMMSVSSCCGVGKREFNVPT
eukprot:scaffold316_cov188-Alexandrium_tamarense.AAC.11